MANSSITDHENDLDPFRDNRIFKCLLFALVFALTLVVSKIDVNFL